MRRSLRPQGPRDLNNVFYFVFSKSKLLSISCDSYILEIMSDYFTKAEHQLENAHLDDDREVSIVDHYASKVSNNHKKINYKKDLMPHMRRKDQRAMLDASLSYVQQEAIDLALGAESESTRATMCQFVLGQAGQGVLKKVEHTVDYKQMQPTELISLIAGKLENIKKFNPDFDLSKFFPSERNKQKVAALPEASKTIDVTPDEE